MNPNRHASQAPAPRPHRGEEGFTLLELLTVLGIFSILMGISLGVFTRSVPTRELARNQLLDKIRGARVFAVAERSPSSVILRRGSEEEWPTITAIGRRTVGSWHLEGVDLDGFGGAAQGEGYEEDPRGVLGRAIRLAGSVPSGLDFGKSASFESPDGLACELFVKLDHAAGRTLVSKGDVFSLETDGSGHLRASVTLVDPEDAKVEIHLAAASDSPVIFPDRWLEVAATFDGLALRVAVEGVTVGEAMVQEFHSVAVDPRAPIEIGDRMSGFGGSVDEFRWGVYVAEVSEPLVDMELLGVGDQLLRFAPGGELDGRFHSGPVDVGLKPLQGPELWVRVGLLGDVN